MDLTQELQVFKRFARIRALRISLDHGEYNGRRSLHRRIVRVQPLQPALTNEKAELLPPAKGKKGNSQTQLTLRTEELKNRHPTERPKIGGVESPPIKAPNSRPTNSYEQLIHPFLCTRLCSHCIDMSKTEKSQSIQSSADLLHRAAGASPDGSAGVCSFSCRRPGNPNAVLTARINCMRVHWCLLSSMSGIPVSTCTSLTRSCKVSGQWHTSFCRTLCVACTRAGCSPLLLSRRASVRMNVSSRL